MRHRQPAQHGLQQKGPLLHGATLSNRRNWEWDPRRAGQVRREERRCTPHASDQRPTRTRDDTPTAVRWEEQRRQREGRAGACKSEALQPKP